MLKKILVKSQKNWVALSLSLSRSKWYFKETEEGFISEA